MVGSSATCKPVHVSRCAEQTLGPWIAWARNGVRLDFQLTILSSTCCVGGAYDSWMLSNGKTGFVAMLLLTT